MSELWIKYEWVRALILLWVICLSVNHLIGILLLPPPERAIKLHHFLLLVRVYLIALLLVLTGACLWDVYMKPWLKW